MSTDLHDKVDNKCVWPTTGFRFEVLMANNNETLKMKATVCPEIYTYLPLYLASHDCNTGNALKKMTTHFKQLF
jgi:hypothetical protein